MLGVGSTADTLYERFARTAIRYPDVPALEVDGERLSYAQLSNLAEGVSAALPAACGPGWRVSVYGGRHAATYAAYLAVLRRGAAVVPLHPGLPAARAAAICRAAGVRAVMVDPATPADPAVAALPDVAIVPADGDACNTAAATTPAGPDDLAYVLFTSGSTGRPKGVPIRHRHVARYLSHCVDRYSVGPGSRLSQAFELSFDPSVHDMFVAWSGGATLIVPSQPELLTVARFVADRGITHWFSTPSVISSPTGCAVLRPGPCRHCGGACSPANN